ncbi:MAG TPA: glycosyltransferase [Gaiellaceae bacterium]|nr:glycosyltransferase [Gaiellaceae bacterium]
MSPDFQPSTDGLVSVVVPVLDGEAFIAESLDSILAQTYAPIEVIVLDDGSTDGTPGILRDFEARGVTVVRHASPLGIYANANVGIRRARGEYVAVFHADDVYEPSLIEQQVTYLRKNDPVGAVFAADIFVDADGREIGRLELPESLRGSRPLSYAAVLNALLTYKNTFLRCPSALVRRSVYEDVGLYDQERFKNTSDLEMWLRIARSYDIAILEEHLFRYRRGHGSSSERYHRLRTDEERFFTILDRELRLAGREVATPHALAAYEAHRAEDTLMRAVACYILGDRSTARRLLAALPFAAVVRSRAVSRGRLALLATALRVLVRLPRADAVAEAFRRRWHEPAPRVGAA